MKKTVLLLMLAAAGCAARPTPIPDAGSAGALLYRARCGACHVAPHPKRNTYGRWESLLGVMERRMEEKGVPPLGTDERGAILDYLRRHSR